MKARRRADQRARLRAAHVRELPPRTDRAIVFQDGVFRGECRVDGLSASGAIFTGATLAIGRPCLLVLRLGEQTLHTAGMVIGRAGADARFGIAFTDLSEQALATIRQVLLARLARAARSPTVLVLGASAAWHAELGRELARRGRRMVVVPTPADAVGFVEDHVDLHRERLEAALVDLSLGPVDGRAFLQYLAQEHPEVRRVVMHDGAAPALDELCGPVAAASPRLHRARRAADPIGGRDAAEAAPGRR